MSSSIRQRAPNSSKPAPANPTPSEHLKAEDKYNPFSLLEIGRVITLLVIASFAVSYFVTREDVWWGHRPAFTKLDYWQDMLRSELQLTPAQLKRFDGSDPTIPLYLAVNGTIYDVSNGRHFYGPSGSYKHFAGADGTRAFVTGCFAEDITPDLRGADEMYIPLDDPAIDNLFTSGELKKQKERERRMAKQQVEQSVKHWVDFFSKSPKYKKVGVVRREANTGPAWPLCEKAYKGKPKRLAPVKTGEAA